MYDSHTKFTRRKKKTKTKIQTFSITTKTMLECACWKETTVCSLLGKTIGVYYRMNLSQTCRNYIQELIIDTCSKLDESQIYYAEWKKPGSKGYTLSDYIYMTFWKGRTIGIRNRSVFSRFRAGNKNWLQRWSTRSFSVYMCVMER